MMMNYIGSLNDPRKKAFLECALDIGCSLKVLNESKGLVKISRDDKSFLLYNNQFFINPRIGTTLTRFKNITKDVLGDVDISIAKGFTALSYTEAQKKLSDADFSYPIVVKPLDAAKGLGVTVDIHSDEELEQAIIKVQNIIDEERFNSAGGVLIEEMVRGKDYRVLILNDKAIACIERAPAHVIGNGKLTISQLIKKFNEDRPETFVLKIDNQLQELLRQNNLDLESVPSENDAVYLRDNANISSGGIATDHTHDISERFSNIARESAKAMHLIYTGVDIITQDITSNDESLPYIIVELNGAPDYDIHEKPVLKQGAQNIAKLLIEQLLQ